MKLFSHEGLAKAVPLPKQIECPSCHRMVVPGAQCACGLGIPKDIVQALHYDVQGWYDEEALARQKPPSYWRWIWRGRRVEQTRVLQ